MDAFTRHANAAPGRGENDDRGCAHHQCPHQFHSLHLDGAQFLSMIRLPRRGFPRRLLSNVTQVRNSVPRRFLSNKADDIAPDASRKTRLRVDRINSRLPKFLQRYTTSLITAPVTHISAFLLLHELTAIVPLFGLAGVFHYTRWLPPYISEGAWVSKGVDIFGKWFRKRGWLGEEGVARRDRWWKAGEVGSRVVVE